MTPKRITLIVPIGTADIEGDTRSTILFFMNVSKTCNRVQVNHLSNK